MALQTRGQITLVATPDYRILATPEIITIPIGDDGKLLDEPFTQEIIIRILDEKNQLLRLNNVPTIDGGYGTITTTDDGTLTEYKCIYSLTNDEIPIVDCWHIYFNLRLENKDIGAADDFDEIVSIAFAKAKSGRDGTPAYGVNLWADKQVFIRSLDESGNYIYDPTTITLTATPINCDGIKGLSYKWFFGESTEPLQIGSEATYSIAPNEENLGMYRVEIYDEKGTFLASDILGIAMAASGTESFTVLLTNDSEIVSVDRDDLTMKEGSVSTDILVYKGANQITDYTVRLGDDVDAADHEEVINGITFTYANGTITGTYDKNINIDAKLPIHIFVGDTEFIKYFYVKASLAGETARMMKITGPQFFQVNAVGDITPENLQLTANPQNIDMGKWQYLNENTNEWIDFDVSSTTLDVKYEGEPWDTLWKDRTSIAIRAVGTKGGVEYYDIYPIYKIEAGKDSYTVFTSNENISIITDVFDRTVEKKTYTVDVNAFLGTAEKTFDIKDLTCDAPEGFTVTASGKKITITVEKNILFSSSAIITFNVEVVGGNSIPKKIHLQPAQQGKDAKYMELSGAQVFKFNRASSGTIVYSGITSSVVSCFTNVPNYKWEYRIANKENTIEDWRAISEEPEAFITEGYTDKCEVIPEKLADWTNEDDILIVRTVEESVENAIFDMINLYKVRDGSNGADSVICYLTNSNIIITENEEGNIVNQTFTTDVIGLWGNKKLIADVDIASYNTTHFTLTTSKGASSTQITITAKNVTAPQNESDRTGAFAFTATITDPEDQQNTHTFNLELNWSIIKGGVEGRGIEEIINYYCASTSNTEIPTSWETSIPTNYSQQNPYLWNYEEIIYTKGNAAVSTPFVIGVFGGKGIKSITDYYLLTNSSTSPTETISGWSTTPGTPNSNNRYLWGYEVIEYTDNTFKKTSIHLVGSYGEKGDKGDKGDSIKGDKGDPGIPGEDGKTIINTTPYYAANQSGTSAPSDDWSTIIPTINDTTYYIWQKNLLTYDDDTSSWTMPFLAPGPRADSIAQQIYDGTLGLNMLGGAKEAITSAVLNNTNGLIITNKAGASLRAEGHCIGLYGKKDDLKIGLSTSNDVTTAIVKGTIYADRGCIGTLTGTGGWTIQNGSIYSGNKTNLNEDTAGIYIGTDGISIENAIKMYPTPQGSGEERSLFEVLNESEAVFKIYKSSNNTYGVFINASSIDFGDSVLKMENGGTGTSSGLSADTVGIYKRAFGQEVSASAANNGDLQILYPSGTLDVSSISVKFNYYTYGGSTKTDRFNFYDSYSSSSKATYFGLTCRFWNIANYAGEKVNSNNSTAYVSGTCWGRVGASSGYTSSSNSCGIVAPFDLSIDGDGTISDLPFTFNVNTNPSGANNNNVMKKGGIVFLVRSKGENALLGSSDYSKNDRISSMAYLPSTTSSTNTTQSCQVTFKGEFTTGRYYAVFYGGGDYSLHWVDITSFGTTGSAVSASNGLPMIQVKALGGWQPINSGSESGSGITYAAGDGINISGNVISTSRKISYGTSEPTITGNSGDLYFVY